MASKIIICVLMLMLCASALAKPVTINWGKAPKVLISGLGKGASYNKSKKLLTVCGNLTPVVFNWSSKGEEYPYNSLMSTMDKEIWKNCDIKNMYVEEGKSYTGNAEFDRSDGATMYFASGEGKGGFCSSGQKLAVKFKNCK